MTGIGFSLMSPVQRPIAFFSLERRIFMSLYKPTLSYFVGLAIFLIFSSISQAQETSSRSMIGTRITSSLQMRADVCKKVVAEMDVGDGFDSSKVPVIIREIELDHPSASLEQSPRAWASINLGNGKFVRVPLINTQAAGQGIFRTALGLQLGERTQRFKVDPEAEFEVVRMPYDESERDNLRAGLFRADLRSYQMVGPDTVAWVQAQEAGTLDRIQAFDFESEVRELVGLRQRETRQVRITSPYTRLVKAVAQEDGRARFYLIETGIMLQVSIEQLLNSDLYHRIREDDGSLFVHRLSSRRSKERFRILFDTEYEENPYYTRFAVSGDPQTGLIDVSFSYSVVFDHKGRRIDEFFHSLSSSG